MGRLSNNKKKNRVEVLRNSSGKYRQSSPFLLFEIQPEQHAACEAFQNLNDHIREEKKKFVFFANNEQQP